jgi:nucleoside-diphosphate-sugar epimerase
MADTIALTGGTGFIGSAVARRLTVAGYQVRGLIRSRSLHKRTADKACRWIEGDLDDMPSLQRLVEGVSAVIHCAGAVRGANRDQFDRVNAAGFERLVKAAVKQHPVPRLLLISSLSAREPQLSHYAASKRQGERVLEGQPHHLFWSIYRPCAVYGPGDREMLPLFRWMARGIAPVLGSGKNRFSLIYVDDLAEAVLKWLHRDCCHSGTYELHDGNPGGYSWHDAIDAVKQLRNKAVLRFKIPLFMVKLAAAINLLAARACGYAPMLTPGKVGELSHPDWVCDNYELNRATGWSPQILLPEGLRLTLNWNEA